MKKICLSFIVLPSVLFIWGCEDDLPKPTENGSNVIACKINGKAWVSENNVLFGGDKFSVVYGPLFKPKYYFVLSARRVTDKENNYIQLALEDLRSTGTQYFEYDTYPYPDNLRFQNHARYNSRKPTDKDFQTNSRFKGSITVTKLDTIDQIIAGTFAFTAEDRNGSGETVKITDGRFDIKY